MPCLLLEHPLEKGCWRKYWEPPFVASSGNPTEGVQSPGPDRAGLGLTQEDGSLAEETDTYIDNYTTDDSRMTARNCAPVQTSVLFLTWEEEALQDNASGESGAPFKFVQNVTSLLGGSFRWPQRETTQRSLGWGWSGKTSRRQ